MALDFSPLQQIDPGGAFLQGRERARVEQERNMLRQQQAEQMAFQRENMLAQRGEREALAADRRAKTAAAAQRQQFLTGLGAKMAEGGYKLDRPTLGQMLQFGMQSGEDSLIKLATEGMRALDEEALYSKEAARFGLPGTAAPTEAPANALAAPPAAPAGVTRETVQNMLMSPSARIREQAKALAQTLSKEEATPSDVAAMKALGFPLTAAGYAQFRDAQRQERMLSPAEEQQRIRIAQASRPPVQPKEPAVRTTKVELADGSIGVMNLDTGVVTPATVGGQAAKGKPSAFAEKTAAQRKQLSQDIDRTITELTSATKAGGLIDQSTGSGAGRGVDIAAGFFGQATPGAIAIGKLAPVADMVLKMVPRFEGPQSNKDTQSYKEAAGQLADPTMPNAIRKQAGLEILRLMKERKGQFVTADMAPEGGGAGGRPSLDDIFKPKKD